MRIGLIAVALALLMAAPAAADQLAFSCGQGFETSAARGPTAPACSS